MNEEIKKFCSIHEEIEFFTNKYKINGDLSIIFEKNAEVAEMNSEMNVANIWRNTFFILEESKKLKEFFFFFLKNATNFFLFLEKKGKTK